MKTILDNIAKRPKRKEVYLTNVATITVVQTEENELFLYVIRDSSPNEALVEQFDNEGYYQFVLDKEHHSLELIEKSFKENLTPVSEETINKLFEDVQLEFGNNG